LIDERKLDEIYDSYVEGVSDYIFRVTSYSEKELTEDEFIKNLSFDFADFLSNKIQDYLKEELIPYLVEIGIGLTSLELTYNNEDDGFEIVDEITLKVSKEDLMDLLTG
jgi:hypothetical protein